MLAGTPFCEILSMVVSNKRGSKRYGLSEVVLFEIKSGKSLNYWRLLKLSPSRKEN